MKTARRRRIARRLSLASLALAVALAIWASVNAIFFDAQTGMTFLVAAGLWLAFGLPLLFASALTSGVRLNRTSLRMPSYWPDWKRDSPFMSASGGMSRRSRRRGR